MPLVRMFLMTATMVTGCSAAQAPTGRTGTVTAPVAQLTTVLKGGTSTIRQPLREVIRESTRWLRVRDSLYVAGKESVPPIDFRREMLLVAVGPRAGLQDSVVIRPLPGQAMRVRVIQYEGCHPAQISIMPFHIVRVPRRAGTVVFEEQTVVDPQCIEPESP